MTTVATPHLERPELPEYMTWEELERLPEEIAGQIELWEGRVAWVGREPAEHQDYTGLLWSGLRRCARQEMSNHPGHRWRVSAETNIFFGSVGKNDFVTPDFLVYRCLEQEYQDIRATDVYIVGEVLSPSNTDQDVEAKKARYASAGIPCYWEVILGRTPGESLPSGPSCSKRVMAAFRPGYCRCVPPTTLLPESGCPRAATESRSITRSRSGCPGWNSNSDRACGGWPIVHVGSGRCCPGLA
jgi:Uma2 family endonuclease